MAKKYPIIIVVLVLFFDILHVLLARNPPKKAKGERGKMRLRTKWCVQSAAKYHYNLIILNFVLILTVTEKQYHKKCSLRQFNDQQTKLQSANLQLRGSLTNILSLLT